MDNSFRDYVNEIEKDPVQKEALDQARERTLDEFGYYSVEVGSGNNAYSVKLRTTNRAQAWAVYKGYNVHSGGRKRLLWKKDGTVRVLDRVITRRWH